MNTNLTRRMLALALGLCMLITCLAFAEGECTHENTYTFDCYYGYECVYIDESSHTMTADSLNEDVECTDCGAVLSSTPIETNISVVEEHTYWDGVCECGATNVCEHPAEYVVTEKYLGYDHANYLNENQHEIVGEYYEYWTCTKCGEYDSNATGETGTEVEDHYFENGVCWACGYENPCEHPAEYVETHTYPDGDNVEYTIIEGDSEQHLVSGLFCEVQYCDYCDSYISEETKFEHSDYEYHYFEGDTCEFCGYVNTCEHPAESLRTYHYYNNPVYTPADSTYHTVVAEALIEDVTCDLCHTSVSSTVVESNVTYTGKHVWDNGTCLYCGYENTCDHPAEYCTTNAGSENNVYTYIDENTHSHTYSLFTYEHCDKCGINFDYVTVDEEVTITEKHSYLDGECVACGYKGNNACTHPEDCVEESKFISTYYKYTVDAVTPTTHTMTGVMIVNYYCYACNSNIGNYSEDNQTLTAEHYFSNGVCTSCGYENGCTHPADSIIYYESDGDEVISTTETTHTTKGVVYGYNECTDCGEIISSDLVSTDKTITNEHRFSGNVCTVCGAQKSADSTDEPTTDPTDQPIVEDTPKPEVTPDTTPDTSDDTAAEETTETTETTETEEEVVYVEAEPEAVVSGVKAEDSLPMVETVLTIVETVTTESETATIKIVNLEKIVTEEEIATLETLPMQEQLLVVLSAIGFDDAITASLEGTEFVLSEEALALKDIIITRLNEMDEETKAEFDAMMLENFPVEIVEIDGVEYSFFVLELEITDGEEVRYEGYGFRFDEETNEWLLTKLYVADEPAEDAE